MKHINREKVENDHQRNCAGNYSKLYRIIVFQFENSFDKTSHGNRINYQPDKRENLLMPHQINPQTIEKRCCQSGQRTTLRRSLIRKIFNFKPQMVTIIAEMRSEINVKNYQRSNKCNAKGNKLRRFIKIFQIAFDIGRIHSDNFFREKIKIALVI